jgi:hypothetical protein
MAFSHYLLLILLLVLLLLLSYRTCTQNIKSYVMEMERAIFRRCS